MFENACLKLQILGDKLINSGNDYETVWKFQWYCDHFSGVWLQERKKTHLQ
jgi:hypothetical protein